MPRTHKPLCGARTNKTRGGRPCLNPAKANGRCRLHGGNTYRPAGANTDVRAANKERLARQAIRRLLGVKAPWGQKPRWKKDMPGEVERLKVKAMGKLKIATRDMLPVRVERDPQDMTMPELLGDVARLSMLKLHYLLSKDRELRDPEGNIIKPMDVRTERFEGDLALGALKVFARVSESALRARNDDNLARLLEAIRAADDSA